MKESLESVDKPFQKTINDETELSRIKKTRKSHKNSKLGCSNCKKNQIKCDETLPICNNCQRKDLPCSYLFMPSDEFQQLVQLIERKETSDVLIESTHRLYDTTLCQPYFNDKIETRAGLNAKLPPVRRQAALRVKKTQNYEEQLNETGLISNVDPILKIFDDKGEQHSTNEVTAAYSINVKYGNSNSDNFIFKQYDQSLPSSPNFPNIIPKFDSFPDQPNVKVASFQESIANTDDTSKQMDSYLRNLKYVVDMPHVGSSISKIREHFLHLVATTPMNYEFEDNEIDYVYENKISESSSDSNDDNAHMSDSEACQDDVLKEKTVNKSEDFDQDSLKGAKIVNKTLKLNAGSEFTWFDPFWHKLIDTFQYLRQKKLNLLFAEWGVFDIDAFFEKVFRVQVNLTPMFSKVSRLASLLFVYDTIKNTLCKQKSILPLLREDMRIAVCRNLEELSTKTLSDLTDLINYEYLSRCNTNYGAQWEVLFTGFVTLSICTVLHYNSGYRQSMSIEQSKKCVDFIGTFTAGLFSMIINQDEEASRDPYNYLRNYSRYILHYSKLIIVPNYNSELFTEIFESLKSLGLNKIHNLKKKSWSSCYIDLYIFLEKHSYFLKVYRDHNSLLGFERGYVVRLINEWYQIFPHDLMNIAYLTSLDEESEILTLLHLTFLAVRYYLEALIPGIRSFIRNSFVSGEKFSYDSTAVLMKVFSLFTTQKHRLYAMYMIRFTTFFCLRFHGISSILANIHIPELSDSKEMTNFERYQSLLTHRKYGNVITEVQKLTMLTSCDSVIQEQNYPFHNKEGKPRNDFEPAEPYKSKSPTEILADFTKTNSGLLSVDYDPRTETLNLDSIASALDKIKIKSNENSSTRNTLAAISHSEVNVSAMKNCWALETQLRV